jgi:hypothetical protein
MPASDWQEEVFMQQIADVSESTWLIDCRAEVNTPCHSEILPPPETIADGRQLTD